MYIEIKYDGAIKECRITTYRYEKIDGFDLPCYEDNQLKYCDQMTQIIVLNALQKIINDYNSEKRMTQLEERLDRYAQEHQSEIRFNMDGKVVRTTYEDAYRQALLDVKHELDMCAANGYKFHVLHVYDFIDKQLKNK